jgi:hypothetical protein
MLDEKNKELLNNVIKTNQELIKMIREKGLHLIAVGIRAKRSASTVIQCAGDLIKMDNPFARPKLEE